MKNKLKQVSQSAVLMTGAVVLGLVIGISLQFVRAWTEPAVAPPGGNVGAPVNTSSINQFKSGWLNVGSSNAPLFTLDVNGLSPVLGSIRTTGGAILNTGGAGNGLLVQNGNVGIGTLAPTEKLQVEGRMRLSGPTGGIVFSDNTVQTTAAVGGGGAIAPGNFYNRSKGTNNWGQVDCLAGDTAISGSCLGQDGCGDSDTTSFGGYPNANGWFCPSQSCTYVTSFVRCYTTKSPPPVFCSNGTVPGDVTPTTGWSACSATLPDVCAGWGCWSGLVSGTFSGTETRTVQTCQSNGSLTPSTQSQACSRTGSYCSDPGYCNGAGGDGADQITEDLEFLKGVIQNNKDMINEVQKNGILH